MSIRLKLLLLGLATLVLPWAGCRYAREMESALRAYLATQASAGSPGSGVAGTLVAGSREKADKAEAGFNRTMARATGVLGTVAGSDADPTQLKALETMQRNHRIAERLARVKVASGEVGKGN